MSSIRLAILASMREVQETPSGPEDNVLVKTENQRKRKLVPKTESERGGTRAPSTNGSSAPSSPKVRKRVKREEDNENDHDSDDYGVEASYEKEEKDGVSREEDSTLAELEHSLSGEKAQVSEDDAMDDEKPHLKIETIPEEPTAMERPRATDEPEAGLPSRVENVDEAFLAQENQEAVFDEKAADESAVENSEETPEPQAQQSLTEVPARETDGPNEATAKETPRSHRSESGTIAENQDDMTDGVKKNNAAVVQQENWVECDRCRKWRKLPAHIALDSLPERWFCELNTWNPATASCEAPEPVPVPSPEKKVIDVPQNIKLAPWPQLSTQPSHTRGEEEKKNDGQDSPPSNASSTIIMQQQPMSRPILLSTPGQYDFDTSQAQFSAGVAQAPHPANSILSNNPPNIGGRLSILPPPPPHHFMASPFSNPSPLHHPPPPGHGVYLPPPPHYQHPMHPPTSSHPHVMAPPSMQQLAGMLQHHPHFFGPLVHPGTPASLAMGGVFGTHPVSLGTTPISSGGQMLYPNGVVASPAGAPRPALSAPSLDTTNMMPSFGTVEVTSGMVLAGGAFPVSQTTSAASQSKSTQPAAQAQVKKAEAQPSRTNKTRSQNNSKRTEKSPEALYQWVQCDRCEKWRRLPGVLDTRNLPEKWFCEMNVWDNSRRTCEAPEETEPEENHDDQQRRFLSSAPKGNASTATHNGTKAKQNESKRSGKRNGSTTKNAAKTKVSRVSSTASNDSISAPQGAQRRNTEDQQQQQHQRKEIQESSQLQSVVPTTNTTTKRVKPVWNWVQCEKRSCRKWRRLPQDIDPDSLPERWVCAMNSWDPRFANCMADEEDADEVDAEDGAEPVCVSVVSHGNTNTSTANKDPGKLSYRELIFTAEGKLRPPFSDRASVTSIFAIGTRINNGKLHDIEAYANSDHYDPRGREFDTSRATTGPKSGKGSRSFIL